MIMLIILFCISYYILFIQFGNRKWHLTVSHPSSRSSSKAKKVKLPKTGSASSAIISTSPSERNATDAKCSQGRTTSSLPLLSITTTTTTTTIKTIQRALLKNHHPSFINLSPNPHSKKYHQPHKTHRISKTLSFPVYLQYSKSISTRIRRRTKKSLNASGRGSLSRHYSGNKYGMSSSSKWTCTLRKNHSLMINQDSSKVLKK